MIDFYNTKIGRIFFDGHVPRLVNALESIAHEMKRANDLKEKESDDENDKV